MDRILGRIPRHGSRDTSLASPEADLQVDQPLSSVTSDGDTSNDDHDYGLFELWPPKVDHYWDDNTRIDVVAIHGLNGHPTRTWSEHGRLWLTDLLPYDLPNARIFTYGYNSKAAFTGSVSRIDDFARTLLERLVAKRRQLSGSEKRPLIFICHSLGGIVLKKALIIAHERSERYSSISRDTFGVMFLGTPHRGSDNAFWGKLFGSLADVFTLGAVRTQLLDDLKPKSECLGSICSQFVERGKSLHRIFSIYERLKIKGIPGLIVDENSAVLNIPNEIPIPIEADHRSMCKFSSNKTEKYRMVADCLKELVDDALHEPRSYDTTTRKDFLLGIKKLDAEDILRKVPRPSPGTCNWILEVKQFQEWLDFDEKRLLWLSGIPGTGKTTMMRFLVENLRRRLQKNQQSMSKESHVSFFFCDSKDWLRNTQGQLVSSLLYQILSQSNHLFRYLDETEIEYYVSNIKQYPGNSAEDGLDFLWSSLRTILQRSTDSKYWIFLDAIDELEPQSWTELLRQCYRIAEHDLGRKVKIVISDRNSPTSRDIRQQAVHIDLNNQSAITNDVRQFISTQLEDLCSSGAIPWQYQTSIEDTLVDISEGNFLQSTLAWTHFRSGVSYWSPQVIKSKLEGLQSISKEAAAYYCSLLERIPEDSREIAKSGFTWVLGSRKPLNVAELQHAVAISAGQSTWVDLVNSLGFNFETQFGQTFGYMLRVDPDDHVRFAHATVKELLTSSAETLSPHNSAVLSNFVIQQDKIDAELAKGCIIMLSFRDFVRLRDIAREALSERMKDFLVTALQSGEDVMSLKFRKYDDNDREEEALIHAKKVLGKADLDERTHTLFSYCVSYWNYHCNQATSDPDVVDSLTRFALLRQSHFFYLVALLLGMAKYHRGAFWDNIDQYARSPPLHFILRCGDHPTVVQSLVQHGEDINGIDSHGWLPLTWAMNEGRRDSLEVLLSHEGASLGSTTKCKDNPIHLACKASVNVDLIQRLLDDPRADVNARSKEGWAVLHWCVSRKEMKPIAISLLQRSDLDINTPNANDMTCLEQIFLEGLYEDLALKVIGRRDVPYNWYLRAPRQLPQPVVDYETFWVERDPIPVSYLYRSSYLQWQSVEDLILTRDPTQALVKDHDHLPLLERYAYHGMEYSLSRVLELLPANIFNKNIDQGTKLLLLCAQQDWEAIVNKLLLKYDLDSMAIDSNGKTLAHWASEFHWRSISSLVESKPLTWLDHASNDGRTALHVAAEIRNEMAAECLLQAGASYHLNDSSGRRAIHIAAECGHRSITYLLLKQPVQNYGKDQHGRSLLHFLVMWHSDAFVRKCMGMLHGKVDVKDQFGRTPLHYASIFQNSPAVSVLLELGANPNLRDKAASTPLHYAAASGSPKSVELLIRAGADIHALNKFRRSALYLALSSESPQLVDYILKNIPSGSATLKRQIRDVDSFGQTVLHRMARWQARELQGHGGGDEEAGQDLYDSDDESYRAVDFSHALAFKLEKYVRRLEALGADVNAKDHHGCTPLHVAVKSGNRVTAEAFLGSSKIKPSIEDERGLTALDWAVVDEHEAIADAIRYRGGEHSVDWKSRLRPLYQPWQEDLDDSEPRPEMMLCVKV